MKAVRILAVVFITLALALTLAPFTWAGTVNLPKSGQTKCYDASGGEIACPNTGQDGNWQAGVSWPSPRFTDNGNGTVTDNLTGLIWLKNANCFGTRTWADALSDANNLASGICGLTDGSNAGDWRLPNTKELRSLINYGEPNSAAWLNNQGFTNVLSIYDYWSSSTYASVTGLTWIVYMWDGYVYASNKAFNFYVWPVRAGTVGTLYTITASANPPAGGSVSCSPNLVNHGSTSTCTITTNSGYTLQNVGGTCSGTLNGSTYTTNPIISDCTVIANFTLNTYTLSITKGGPGMGLVVSNPTGINCGSDCNETYNHGTAVTLTATPDSGYIFIGWGGDCLSCGLNTQVQQPLHKKP